jgi:hypothetical protein
MPENDLDFMNSNYVTQRGRCHHGHVEIVFVAVTKRRRANHSAYGSGK